jgi:hypothetical protein
MTNLRMGLHDPSERKQAYGMARRAFEAGMRSRRHGRSADYEIGYIVAIRDLAIEEGAEDLAEQLEEMHGALLESL